MSWADAVAEVATWTTRPGLVAETNLAIRQAIRKLHRSARFWRDIQIVNIVPTPVVVGTGNLQLDLTDLQNYRQAIYLRYPTQDTFLSAVDIADLLDQDNFLRDDVYWGMGNNLQIRTQNPQDSYVLAYLTQPTVVGNDSDSWIFQNYQDAVVLTAAAAILKLIGEDEIRVKCEQLAAEEMRNLIQDNLEVEAR